MMGAQCPQIEYESRYPENDTVKVGDAWSWSGGLREVKSPAWEHQCEIVCIPPSRIGNLVLFRVRQQCRYGRILSLLPILRKVRSQKRGCQMFSQVGAKSFLVRIDPLRKMVSDASHGAFRLTVPVE